MDDRRIGRTDLRASAIGLGTMTWGRQNTQDDAFAQMDLALDAGITFWDTAEMYAVPPTAETYGRTETIIGNWFASRGGRDRVVLASKVIGNPRGGFDWVRGGRARLDRANLTAALDASLTRLRTDRIDLYQLHWPDRVTPRFGQRSYQHSPDDDGVPLEETLGVLDDFIKAGKIRAVGLSNETPWGVMHSVRLAETRGLPRVATIQNAYNLLNRTYESGLAEVGLREDVGLLAYAPLAAGTLSGKYLGGVIPPGTRRALDPRRWRYDTPNVDPATKSYVEIARRHGLSPTQMAISFVVHQPFVTSALIGATTLEHLRSNIAAYEVRLSDEVLKEIETVHIRYNDPCP